ncbi:dual specificity protein phosphatase family protein [Phototrophicus methaneseepsis]|uniref:Dual specificity protein phosphatase family protein n=1 Tax=Phototrophicus methaneseepsis TaxID=2710758 RepID=A0A7S8IDI2_9CHLR|nr:dual specificity protein phosphatase [Phototrophicus methaneseepsis]QPC82620.1 dual specificity protein phosphatase family protein [Phototrophicus methaneseepsis]
MTELKITHVEPLETKKPPSQLSRIASLLRTGPRGLSLRFIDQGRRKRTGAPTWSLSKVTPNLYVGGQHYKKGWQQMLDEGITAVLNMREAHLDDVVNGIGGDYHLHLPTRDNTPPSLEDLQCAAEFIDEHVRKAGKVYVHCGIGVGRAPSAAAAYLIYTGMSADEALAAIREVRPFIHLTPGQYRQLKAFEAEYKGKGTPIEP